MLAECSFSAISIEAVAARSGSAKTTIYRHWPTKQDLLIDVVDEALPVAEAPDTGRVADDLRHFAHDLARILKTELMSSLITGVVDASEREPGMAKLLADFTVRRRRPIHGSVKRAIARGELDAAADPDLIASLLLGPLFYRRLISHQPINNAFLSQLVSAVLAAAGATPVQGGERSVRSLLD
ncbi:TetR/AcrR family transcriptional regulator [Fodinicola feengrottensis]|uniref:TetR/AcrR family transcriptional regulator n=1 Tax=Fodinicola feengrottensis TaxID=435914 RepID=A0ABN2J7X6_9ACTN